MSEQPKRSILKTGTGSTTGRSAKWDEHNLAVNEQIKAELAPAKIEEPKTPYHAPLDPDAEMEPFDLENDAAEAGPSGQAAESKHLQERLAQLVDQDQQGDFSKQRQSHYNMKNALARGKELLQEQEESEPDEDAQTHPEPDGAPQPEETS